MFGNIIDVLGDVTTWISNLGDRIINVFSDVDFTLLYDWLPDDIQSVISSVILVLLALALIGLIKKAIIFLG